MGKRVLIGVVAIGVAGCPGLRRLGVAPGDHANRPTGTGKLRAGPGRKRARHSPAAAIARSVIPPTADRRSPAAMRWRPPSA